MDNVNFYWTVVAAVVAAGWGIFTFIRDRILQSFESNKEIVTRMLEDDKLIIENPEIQEYLSENAKQDVMYFRNDQVLKDIRFFKAKAFVYKQINMFDEILTVSSRAKGKFSILHPSPFLELSDWENYIKLKLRHPLYQSILSCEEDIFGQSLRSFWNTNKEDILSKPCDTFIW